MTRGGRSPGTAWDSVSFNQSWELGLTVAICEDSPHSITPHHESQELSGREGHSHLSGQRMVVESYYNLAGMLLS